MGKKNRKLKLATGLDQMVFSSQVLRETYDFLRESGVSNPIICGQTLGMYVMILQSYSTDPKERRRYATEMLSNALELMESKTREEFDMKAAEWMGRTK